ncbi:hypothetical protein F5888DRAFT_1666010 [Russula emetica]|nr:hypothetical protein F5888DRAFT_1666010 [Russula emetica]
MSWMLITFLKTLSLQAYPPWRDLKTRRPLPIGSASLPTRNDTFPPPFLEHQSNTCRTLLPGSTFHLSPSLIL